MIAALIHNLPPGLVFAMLKRNSKAMVLDGKDSSVHVATGW